MFARLMRNAIAIVALALPSVAWGQSAVLQGGPWVTGHPPCYQQSGSGTQPVVRDCGPAAGGGAGVGLSELNITARGAGTAPYVGLGTGQLGTIFQIQDAPSTAAGGHVLSFSANAQGGGLIAYNPFGNGAQLPLSLNINGATYQFPFSISGIVGPVSSVIGDVVCWNNTVGSVVKDCMGTLQLSGSSSGTSMISVPSVASGVWTLPNATDQFVGRATTDTLTHKTYDTAGAGNVFSINGNAVSAVTGTGPIAVMSVSPALTGVPTVPTAAFGTNTTQVASTANVRGAIAGITLHVQAFSANATYTPTANLIYAVVECWGGGGGGGGVSNPASTIFAGAAGGGAGGYSSKVASAATIGASQSVTAGAAGTGATAGNNAGGNGGDTAVGTLCIGKGGTGGGGTSGATNSFGAGGAGGIAGTGDVTGTGAPGTGAVNSTARTVSGAGGSSSLGGGGVGTFTASGAVSGVAATGFASGGGGGASQDGGGNAAGGAGSVGFVRITEYCSQ